MFIVGKWFVIYGFVPFGLSIVASILFIAGFSNIFLVSLATFLIGGIFTSLIYTKKLREQSQLSTLLIPLTYTALIWAIFMFITNGFSGDGAWLVYAILHAPLTPLYLFASFIGEGRLFFWAPFTYELAILLPFLLIILIKQREQLKKPSKKLLTIGTIFILAIGSGSAIQLNRNKTVLPPSYGFQYGDGYSSTDIWQYDVTNENNKLPELSETVNFSITDIDEMPILDGAEAAYPVYSAFANATYENIKNINYDKKEIISFTNTIYAFERLLSGEVDIFFGAEPSSSQRQLAKDKGKELVMTPIGKEAFVFFVNPKNEVSSLTVAEIQAIYSGKIKNWSELGGKNEKIIAFQRPKNSGSQTLLEKIMGDTPITEPLKEEVPQGMGGILERVADYRNYDNAIGFSFRFFATGMNENTNIQFLAINDIEPTSENITSEAYPFTASLYAITLKDQTKPMIQPFLDWMQGPQGQEIVEQIGYIKAFER